MALVFAVHPALTQAVAWIPGRNDSQLAIFILLSFFCFLEFLDKRERWAYFTHLLFFILALLTKETAVGLALICPLYVWLLFRKREAQIHHLVYSFSLLGLTVDWMGIRHLTFLPVEGYTFFYMVSSIFANSPALLVYAGKILFPFNLSVLPILRDSSLLYGAFALIVVFILLLISKEKRINFVLFGAGWFLLFLLPALITPRSYPPLLLLENRNYLPMIGFMIVLLETDLIKRLSISIFPMAAVLVLFLAATLTYSQAFRDERSFWQNAAAGSPHFSTARARLGHAYYTAGKLAAAEKECLESIKLDPKDPSGHHFLAAVHVAKKLYASAEAEYKNEIKLDPTAQAHMNLGVVYYLEGRLGEAEKEYNRCLQINPYERKAHNNLAAVFAARKQNQKAEAEYLKELQAYPDSDAALYNLGMIYKRLGKSDRAREFWRRAIAANPYNFNAYRELVDYYWRKLDFRQMSYYRDSLRIREAELNR